MPIPVQVLRRLACIAAASNDPELQAIADMIIIAFFFLPAWESKQAPNLTVCRFDCQMSPSASDARCSTQKAMMIMSAIA